MLYQILITKGKFLVMSSLDVGFVITPSTKQTSKSTYSAGFPKMTSPIIIICQLAQLLLVWIVPTILYWIGVNCIIVMSFHVFPCSEFKRALPLPSEAWYEFDAFCHGDDHKPSQLIPREGDLLSGESVLLVDGSSLSSSSCTRVSVVEDPPQPLQFCFNRKIIS